MPSGSFRYLPTKKLDHSAAHQFWKQYDIRPIVSTRRRQAGSVQRPSFDQKGYRTAEPVRVTASTLGVVRHFERAAYLRSFIRAVTTWNRLIKTPKFHHMEVIPTEILGIDRKKNRLVERAYKAPNLGSVTLFVNGSAAKINSLYGELFWKKMERKGVVKKELAECIRAAWGEIMKLHKHGGMRWIDANPTNIILLDYDPRAKKLLLAAVDL